MAGILCPVDEGLRLRLRRALDGEPRLALAFVFGSVARGSEHAGSDLDVAILPVDRDLTLAAEGELCARFERASGRSVDVVRIDGATDALRWRIARDGVVLTETQPGAAARWQAQVAIEHADFEPVYTAGLERYRAALARGTPAR